MKIKRYHNPTSFIDLLFLCLVGFVFLLVIAFLLIMPPVDDNRKKPKAEFLVTLTWDSQTDDDVDLWIQNPVGDMMWFRKTNIGLMHLDHDDVGHDRDQVIINGQQKTQHVNQEIATVRGFIAGEWIINIHMYAKRYTNPANINVRVDKLNPRFTTLIDKNYIMKDKGEEITVVRMTMTSKGEITEQSELLNPLAGNKITSVGL